MADVLRELQSALAGRYDIERLLGSGGMADVYLAEDLRHHRPVAVKVLRPDVAGLVGAERFLGEIEVLAHLRHPHILPLYDSGIAAGLPYYVMPYAPGATLRDRLASEKQLPIADAVHIASDVARALQFAHDQNVIHRDIKPENILLEDGEAVVADFGIARAVWALGGKKLTETGVSVGTPPYMSPEQVLGETADERSDLYALGCVLYEMLAGQSPFTGPNAESLVYQHLNAPPPDVRQLRASVPPALAQLVQQLLAKTAADRPAGAGALRAALDALREPNTGRALDSQAVTQPVRPSNHRRIWRWVSVSLLVLAGALVVTLWLRSRAQPSGLSPTKIAVFPFEVNAAGDLNYLREAMVTLLSVALDGAGELWTADHNGLLSIASRQGSARPSPAEAEVVARRFGAGLFVLGDVIETGSSVRLQGRIYRIGASHERIADVAAVGSADSLAQVVDRLAAGIIRTLSPGPPGRPISIAARTTHSLEALKAFARGEAELRRGSFEKAMAAYQRTVELDSTFSLAWHRLAYESAMVFAPSELRGNHPFARDAIERAVRWSDRLPEQERRLVRAHRAARFGELAEAESLYRSVLERDTHHLEAWEELGDLLSFYNGTRGRRKAEAHEARWHAATLDPGDGDLAGNLMWIEMMLGNFERVDSLFLALSGLVSDPDMKLWWRAHYAFVRQDTTAQDKVLQEMRDSAVTWSGVLARNLVYYTGSLEGSERIPRRALPTWWSKAARGIPRGRWHEASDSLLAHSDDIRWARYGLAFFASLPFMPASEEEITRARELILDTPIWNDERSHVGARGMTAVWRACFLGRLSARLGDRALARAYASELDSLHRHYPFAECAAEARDFGAGIRAALALAEGDPAMALEELESAPMKSWWGGTDGMRFRLFEHWLRAEALHALDRDDEALPWYETIHEGATAGVYLLAPAHLRQAQIHESLGHRDQAVHHYQRFIDIWSDCDPELRPQVDEARARVSELVASRG